MTVAVTVMVISDESHGDGDGGDSAGLSPPMCRLTVCRLPAAVC